MNIENLSDTELNRAMIDTLFIKGDKDIERSYQAGKLNFLKDWNLTMPLAVKNNISLINDGREAWAGTDICAGDGPCVYMDNDSLNTNPLRAICEVLVQIALTKT